MSTQTTYTPYWYDYFSGYGVSHRYYVTDIDCVSNIDPEHRPKPDPLTMTERHGQYKYNEIKGLYRKAPSSEYFYQYSHNIWIPSPQPNKHVENEILGQINSEFINASMYIAELRSSLTLAYDVAKALVGIFTSVTNPINFARSISNAWLANMYGLQPTISDIHNLSLNMHETFNNANITFTDRFFELQTQGSTFNSYKSERIDSWSTRYKVSARLIPPSIYYFGSPISTLWEMIPYSFVFDWFIPVSDYLAYCDTQRLIKSMSGHYTVKHKFSIKSKRINETIGTTRYSNIRDYEYHSKEYDRYLITHVPEPVLPRFQPSFGTTRLLNSAALLTQLLKQRG